MNICVLQHVPFEGSGTIAPYFEGRGHHIEIVRLYSEYRLPELGQVDLLVVMGGPMSVSDTDQFPFLEVEKVYISQAIDQHKWVLGICLGAQLVAQVLGAEVGALGHKEIGWYPVQQTPAGSDSWLCDLLPRTFDCLHWHGDSFTVPDGALHLATSTACAHQAFVWHRRIIGLQFHLEFTPASTSALIEKSRDELVEGPWIQDEAELLKDGGRFGEANRLMARILEHIEAEIEFQLNPQLDRDCHWIGDLECSRVLLHRNAEVPWFILVPRCGRYRDLDDMSGACRTRLLAESDRIANLLRQECAAEKIDVAALGNYLPQLHVHVIGRVPDDPVWGNLSTQSAWKPARVDRFRDLIQGVQLN